jgi:hypothetical protein
MFTFISHLFMSPFEIFMETLLSPMGLIMIVTFALTIVGYFKVRQARKNHAHIVVINLWELIFWVSIVITSGCNLVYAIMHPSVFW